VTTVVSAGYPALRRAAAATGAVFALSGVLQATWVSRLPEVRTHLSASTGSLGIALLGSAVGSICSTPLTGRLTRRFGSRAVVAGMSALSFLALVGLGVADSVWQLGLTLLIFGLGYGSWDVAMNVHGHGVESTAGKAWMPRYHSAWSVGSFVAAGIGSAVAGARLPIEGHFVVVAVVGFGAVLACLTAFLADSDDAVGHPPPPAGERRRIFTTRLALLGVVMACSTMIEGAAADWLGIYLDTVRHTGPAAGAAGYTTFAVAMAVSRGVGTWTITALGRARAVRASGCLAVIGVGLLLLSPDVALCYVGAALWGLGVAIVFPAVISAAGEQGDRPADTIAMVTPVGYSGFLIGPPLIGLLAEVVGLEHSMWAITALAAVMAVLANVAREREDTPAEATI